MKPKMSYLVVAVLMLLIPTSLPAYLHENRPDTNPAEFGNRLIVKINPEIKITPKRNKMGVVSVGVPSIDRVQNGFGVTDLKALSQTIETERIPRPFLNVFIVTVPEGVDRDELTRAYADLAEVVYAEPDVVMELYDAPDDPWFSQQWGLHNSGQEHLHVYRYDNCYNDILGVDTGTVDADIDALEVFENPPDQTVTAVVAIIDTGVDMDHPDLAGRIWINPGEIPDNGIDDDHNGYIDDIHGWDFCSTGDYSNYSEDNDPTDPYGHGTHCSGIVTAVVANNEGVAGIVENCRIMALKFYPIMLSSFAARAIVYAADNGADVISMSWGYPWPVQTVNDALAYARDRGVVLVAAAGNDGAEKENCPAATQGVFTVAASDHDDLITVFSTYGSHIEISAPGLTVLSLRSDTTDMYGPCEAGVHLVGDHYYLASGTSMACPHVAGVAAYMHAVSPGLTPFAIEDLLAATADDFVDPYNTGANYPGWDKYSGYGRVNLKNALEAVPESRARINAPLANAVVGGLVAIGGIADGADFSEYVIEFGSGALPTSWTEIATSSTPVTDDVLATWDTEGLNGQYTIRLRVGLFNSDIVTVYVINDDLVEIQTPQAGDTVISWKRVIGSVAIEDFQYYQLAYAVAAQPNNWFMIRESNIPVVNGEIAVWNTDLLAEGHYLLRLSVYSTSVPVVADTVAIVVQSLFSSDRGWKAHFNDDVTVVPNYGDFNGDEENEIVVGTEEGLFFYRPDGTLLTSDIPATPPDDFRTPVAVGKLDDDDVDDMVAVGVNSLSMVATLYGFRSGASDFAVELPFIPNLDAFNGSSYDINYPSVSLRDFDHDGHDEILYYSGMSGVETNRLLYNENGEQLYSYESLPSQYPPALLADIDGNDLDEFYATNSDSLFCCQPDGSIDQSYAWPGFSGSFKPERMAAFDIDHDMKLELIVSGYYDGGFGTFQVFAFDENLSVKPGWPHDTGIDNYVIVSAPVFGDIDLDGSLEYFMTMWELTAGQVFGWHLDGTSFGGDSSSAILAASPNPSITTAPILADVNNDSQPDIVTCLSPDAFNSYNVERIIAWNNNGEVVPGWPVVTIPNVEYVLNFCWHSPVVGDIDRDGFIDLIITTLQNDIVFVNFEGMYYRPSTVLSSTWKYNRRMNSIGSISSGEMVCGDANGDGYVNLLDILFLITYLYGAPPGPAPEPPEAGDANADGSTNLLDILYLIDFLYGTPPGPVPLCP